MCLNMVENGRYHFVKLGCFILVCVLLVGVGFVFWG